MILTGFADPDTEKFASERPPASSASAAVLSVPPQALPGVSRDDSWKDLDSAVPPGPDSKR